jgi:hypothetical protein
MAATAVHAKENSVRNAAPARILCRAVKAEFVLRLGAQNTDKGLRFCSVFWKRGKFGHFVLLKSLCGERREKMISYRNW